VIELFPDNSPSSIDKNDVSIDTTSYPNTIEGCEQIISKLRNREKALHFMNVENEDFLSCLQSDALIVKHRLEKEHLKREHWEGEYYRYSQEVQRLNKEGDKNQETIKELHELVQHLKETTPGPTDGGASPTQTLDTIQRELESK